MANPRNRGGRVSNLINTQEERARVNRPKQRSTTGDEAPATPPKPQEEDNDVLIQGLTPGQLRVLAIKVYDLLLDEIRLEAERTGKRSSR